jgi:hypothetical protein
MKFIALFLLVLAQLSASVVESSVKSIDNLNNKVTIEVDEIDSGISGYIVHKISNDKEIILKNVVVDSFDEKTKTAVLSMKKFDALNNNSLPNGKWKVEVGDKVILAFAYNRALLIAPNEDIYHRISKAVNVEWVHPDIFATILSLNAHPTPTKKDFLDVSSSASVGLVYFYLKEKLYTVDAKSFKILSVASAPLEQKTTQLPFYMRIDKIENNWWNMGDGTDQLEDYDSYYKALLLKYNPDYRGEI